MNEETAMKQHAMLRDNQYYWVEFEGLAPEIALYSEGNNRWYLIGSHWKVHAKDDVRVIQRVPRPR